MTPKGQWQSSDQSFEPERHVETSPIGPAAPARFVPTPAPRRSVDLQIDELILDGFSDADRSAIGEAVERELTRLFTEQGVPPAITFESETAELDGGALETNSTADGISARVARAIYGGLSR